MICPLKSFDMWLFKQIEGLGFPYLCVIKERIWIWNDESIFKVSVWKKLFDSNKFDYSSKEIMYGDVSFFFV